MELKFLIVIAIAVVMNIVGFLSMFIDKRRAIKQKWRIKESVLLAISFLGGGLGSWIGMYVFRHKTKHLKFVIGVPICFIVSYAIMLTAVFLL